METVSMDGSPSGDERAAKRPRRDNDGIIKLPPEVWVGVLKYLPQCDVLTCGAVSRSMLHVMPFLTSLHIDQSSQMNVAVARRFRDAEDIHIDSLLSFEIQEEGTPHEWNDIDVDFQSISRLVPFLSRFDKLQRVFFGGKLENFAVAEGHFWGEGDDWYPNLCTRERMLQVIDNISIGYQCGALRKQLKVFGICCPDTTGHRPVHRQCETCLRACRSFPLESVVGFECMGSSANNALSGRSHGIDVCIERAQIESIIESRPGGPELLRSKERVLRLLSSARRYKISSDAGHVYIAKYDEAAMAEIQRVIKYADLDAKKIHAQTVSDAVMQSFVSDSYGSTTPTSRELCYVSEDSLDYLKNVVGLSFSTDNIERPLKKHAQRITSAFIDASWEADSVLALDCLRLVRRLLGDIETLHPIDGIEELISSLVTCLKSTGKLQEEAVRALKMIVVGGEKEHIETFATPEAISGCIALLAAHADVAKDSLGVLVAARDHIRVAASLEDDGAGNVKALLPHLVRIMKSPEQVDMLGDCSVLLRHLLGVDDPPIKAVIGSGIASQLVEAMTATVDEGIRSNLAHAMMDLAHHHCQMMSNPGGEEQNAVVVKESGYLSALRDLRRSPFNEIATKATTTLQSIASSNVTEKWSSWKEKETLAWGEYEVTGELADLLDEDDGASLEEAEEVSDEQVQKEDEQAAVANRVVDIAPYFNASYEESPTLLGLPNEVLTKILDLATGGSSTPICDGVSSVLPLELVCKRIRSILRSDDFWSTVRKTTVALLGIRKYQKRSVNETLLVLSGDEEGYEIGLAETIRNLSANLLSRMIDSQTDQMPEVHFRLRGDAIWFLIEVVEGYMVEKLAQAQLAAIHRSSSIGREVQKEDISFVFQKKGSCPASFGSEISQSTLKQPGLVHPFDFSRYLPLDERGSGGDSLSHRSSSGILWRWPDDNCCDVLPPEAGRRIIRRLAFRGGVKEMSGGAFMAAEAELLHAWGILLADAYESSVELGKTATYLTADDLLAYGKPAPSGDSGDILISPPSSSSETANTANEEQPNPLVRQLDMFKIPPPPFRVPREATAEGEDCQHDAVHTIVPGLLEEAAERRGIGPARVYGNGWIPTLDSTPAHGQDVGSGGSVPAHTVKSTEAAMAAYWARYDEQLASEHEIEDSYYFGPYDEDFPEGFYESDEDGQTESSGADGQEADGQESNEVSS